MSKASDVMMEMRAARVRQARPLAWIALVLGIVGLLCTLGATLYGAPFRWYAWVLPLLIIGNVSTNLGILRRWPRLEKAYYYVSAAIALAALVGLFFEFRNLSPR